MPERFKVVCIPCKALYKCSAFTYFLPLSYNIQFTYEHYAIKKQILFQLVYSRKSYHKNKRMNVLLRHSVYQHTD